MAESSQPKQRGCLGCKDYLEMAEFSQSLPKRLCNLPKSVLAEVLSLLPIKQAVSTSILSKRWETIWTSVSVLDFDDSLTVGKKMSDRERKLMFRDFVYSVVIRHRPTEMKRFSLVCNLNYDAVDIATWVGYALEHKVKEVELNIKLERLPRRLFNCDSLSVMKLKLVSLVALASFSVSLPQLMVLHLGQVTFKHHDHFVKLLLGCPVLEELVLENVILDCECLHSKFELNLEKLSRASIGFSYFKECMKVLFFHAVFCNVTSLFISWSADLSFDSIPNVFMNLKQLEVSWGIYYWDRLITFLHHCPQLEQLIICKDTLTSPKPQHEWNPIPDTPLEHLKYFCMKNYEGSDIELEIIGYVLKNAIMLETFKIYFAGSLPSNKVRDQIVKSLSKLPRTSKNCHVLLHP